MLVKWFYSAFMKHNGLQLKWIYAYYAYTCVMASLEETENEFD